MMALVPSTASTLARGTSNITNTTAVSSGNSGNADKVCGILQEIRDEFHTLKTYLVKNDKSSDQSNLNDVLNRTEHTIKERTDEVLNMLNGNIATLTFNQMAAVASGNNSSMFEQLYNLQTRDGSRKLTFMPNGNNRQSEYSIPSIPVITIGPSSNQQPRIAPGMAAKMEYESKIIRNPFNQKNRQVLYDNFGIQLPLIERQQQKQFPSKNLMSAKTTEPLGILPMKTRRNPVDYPVPLTSDDAKRGIISLVERGIIPQGAHITLEPPPIQPKKSSLYDPITRSRTAIKDEPSSSIYRLDKDDYQQTSDPNMSLVPLDQRVKSASPQDKKDRLSLTLSESDRDCSIIMKESRKSSANRTATNKTMPTIDGRQPLPTPASTFEYKKNFRLVIQNGLTKDQTEDFIQYRQYYCLMWGSIITVFRMLEKLMHDYSIPIAFINGEKVTDIAQTIEHEHKPTLEELLNVIINRDDVEEMIKRPGRRFIGPGGQSRAAIVIQSYWRCFRDRRAYVRLRKRKWAVGVIALTWLTYCKLSKVRRQLKVIRRRQLDFFAKKQLDLRRRWPQIQSQRRVIVHLPSLGLTHRVRRKLNNLPVRENFQIGRLCDIYDPNVDVIYVSPMPINNEVLQYYNKLVNLRPSVEKGELVQQDNAHRFMIVVPEALHSFPTHSMCLATLLKYSPQALKRIKNLIRGREAYMVTGVSHFDDLYLAEYLDIAVIGCEPEVSYLYSSKSGSKRVFEAATVPLPYGEFDVYNQQQLYESLAQLIIEHLDVQRWLFKIDDDYDGLGIAYCDVVKYLPCYKTVLKEAARFGDKWAHKWAQEHSYAKVLSELPDVLEQHTIYVNKTQFSNWNIFLKVFLTQGGIIEAYPPSDSVTSLTVCIFIEPDGQIRVLCSGDHLHAESEFSCWGLSFPQSSVDPTELNSYCQKIAEQCKQRNIFGYLDIDFVTFIDAKSDKQQLWAVDLSIGYSEHVSMYNVMRYVTTGKFDSSQHLFDVSIKQTKRLRNWQNGAPEQTTIAKSRYAVWSSRLHHTNLSVLHYSVFFQMCRAHGVGFDIKEKQGSVFTLLECDRHENLGMISIGETLQGTLSNFAYNLNSINQEITTNNMQGRTNFLLAINDIENILGITQENASSPTSSDAEKNKSNGD